MSVRVSSSTQVNEIVFHWIFRPIKALWRVKGVGVCRHVDHDSEIGSIVVLGLVYRAMNNPMLVKKCQAFEELSKKVDPVCYCLEFAGVESDEVVEAEENGLRPFGH